MNERLTVEQALEITINNLKGISVPISYYETIAEPIRTAIENIEVCIEALQNAKKNHEQDEEVQEETGEATESVE